MYTNKREELNTQLNAEGSRTDKETYSPSEETIVEREKIENSPFETVGNKKEGYFLAFANFRLTECQPSKLDIRIFLEQNKWDIILKTILAVIELVDTEKSKE